MNGKNDKESVVINSHNQILNRLGKLTGRSAITWLIALHAAADAPVCMAFMDTSMRKK